MQLDVHRMTSDWEENSAYWNNLNNSYNSKIEDYIIYQYNSSTPSVLYEQYFNITSIAKDWYTTGNNYGLMIKEHKEINNYTEESDMYFVSKDTNASAYYNARPQVTIIYRNQTGIEDYLSYHIQSVGRAGTIYTNDYNGNLILEIEDASTTGNRLPITIKHVYNTNYRFINHGLGNGFRLNLSQAIGLYTINNIEYAKYIDEDGTAHFFKKEGATNIYKDEDGLGLVLTLENNIFKMSDKQGNKLQFIKKQNAPHWQLQEIEDVNGNKAVLEFDSTITDNYYITKLTDGAGSEIILSYTDGKLNTITDSAGRITSYLYDTNGNLNKIIYSDNKESVYTYYSDNKLKSVENIDGIMYEYEYYSGVTGKVKTIKEYSNINELGNKLNIIYKNNATIFIDDKGYSQTSIFNNLGNKVSIADFGKEGNNINDAYGKTYKYGTQEENTNKILLESNLVSVGNMPNNMLQNPKFDNSMTGWKEYSTTANDKILSSNGNKVYSFLGEYDKTKYIYQEFYQNGNKGDVFSFYGWAKNDGVQNSDDKTTRSARIMVRLTNNNGQLQDVSALAVEGIDGWQFLSEKVVANFDYTKVTFYLMFYRNANTIQFDNVGLFKEEYGKSYKYDKNGNITSMQDLAKQNSNMQYNGNNELLKQVTPKGGNYVYEYDSKIKNRLLSITNNSKINYNFEYDDYGNTCKITISNKNKISTEIVPGKKYYIRSSGTNKYINVSAGGTIDGTDVTLNILNGNMKHQEWKVYDAGNGYYYLKPGHADNMALTTTNTVVDIQTFTGNDNQKYKFEKNTDGSFVIKSKVQDTTYAVAVDKEIRENAYYIMQEIYEGEENQKFFFENVETDNSIDETIIESGEVYYLKNKVTGFYLDYQNQSDIDGTKIVQKTFSGSDSQKWRLIRNENGTYKIIPLFSGQGRAITMDGQIGTETRANFVEMSLFSNTDAMQQWWILKQADDSFLIRTNHGGTTKELCISSDSQLEGIEAITFEHGGRNTQYWCLEPANMVEIEDGATYKIKNKNSNLYVGVANSQDVNGTNIEQVGNETLENQEWIIENLRNGYYRMISKNSQDGKVMEMQNGASTHATNVQLSSWNGTIGQQWEFVPSNNGEVFYIKPRNAEGRGTLDVQNSGITVGTNIVMANYNGSTAQQFYLEKTSLPEIQYIETSAEYSSDGKYLTKIIDELGNSTQYEYNQTKGTVTKVTDAKNSKTLYEYDNLDRITKVSKQVDNKNYNNIYTYENDAIKTITHNGFSYNFIYDNFGNVKQTKVGNQTLATNNYEANNGNLESIIYGNNQQILYGYDRFNRLQAETKTQGTYQYTYDSKSNLKSMSSPEGIIKNYSYDLADRLVKANDTYGFERNYTYDENNNVDSKKYVFGSIVNETKYSYDKDNRINNIKLDNNKILKINYDRLSRIDNKQLKVGTKTYTTQYTYKDLGNNKTTTSITSMKNGTNAAINYTYDELGNIETIKEGTTLKAKYYYDSLNQLIREDNAYLNKSITYEYDLGGNITTKKEYAYTTGTLGTATKTISYTYGNSNWKDQLTKYNGTTITYDNIGNPLSYGNNTYTWQNGRELYSITNSNSGLEVSYRYDENGIRRAKVVNGVVTRYHTEGDKVIYEKVDGSNNIIYYSYDENGNIIGLKYNDTQYYYIKNIQGDIIGILDNDLQQIVSYTYTSWGELISIKDSNGNEITSQTHIGIINPYRYRSYRYDTETGLYYLQSRYYNPEWGRFLNADGYIQTGQGMLDKNMFAYCGNNPINRIDTNGKIWKEIGDFFKNIANSIINFFGASSQVSVVTESTEYLTPTVISPVSVKVGTTISTVNSSKGNSSKAVSVYANGVSNNPVASSAGIKINIGKCSLDFGVGLTDTSLKFLVSNRNITTSSAFKADITNLQIGFEMEVEEKIATDVYVSGYSNASINGGLLLAGYMLFSTGNINSGLQYAY